MFAGVGGRLMTGPGGYSLRVATDELDASVFEELAAQAAATADRRRVLGLQAEALGLWRGRAFEEFADADWAIGEASRLDTLRLRALEVLVDAEVDVGDLAVARRTECLRTTKRSPT